MFDGNHRSNRKVIDLSGRKKTKRFNHGTPSTSIHTNKSTTPISSNINSAIHSSSNSKADLLQQMQIQREERYTKQKRNGSALLIQKWYRGYRDRCRIVDSMLALIFENRESTNNNNNHNHNNNNIIPSDDKKIEYLSMEELPINIVSRIHHQRNKFPNSNKNPMLYDFNHTCVWKLISMILSQHLFPLILRIINPIILPLSSWSTTQTTVSFDTSSIITNSNTYHHHKQQHTELLTKEMKNTILWCLFLRLEQQYISSSSANDEINNRDSTIDILDPSTSFSYQRLVLHTISLLRSCVSYDNNNAGVQSPTSSEKDATQDSLNLGILLGANKNQQNGKSSSHSSLLLSKLISLLDLLLNNEAFLLSLQLNAHISSDDDNNAFAGGVDTTSNRFASQSTNITITTAATSNKPLPTHHARIRIQNELVLCCKDWLVSISKSSPTSSPSFIISKESAFRKEIISKILHWTVIFLSRVQPQQLDIKSMNCSNVIIMASLLFACIPFHILQTFLVNDSTLHHSLVNNLFKGFTTAVYDDNSTDMDIQHPNHRYYPILLHHLVHGFIRFSITNEETLNSTSSEINSANILLHQILAGNETILLWNTLHVWKAFDWTKTDIVNHVTITTDVIHVIRFVICSSFSIRTNVRNYSSKNENRQESKLPTISRIQHDSNHKVVKQNQESNNDLDSLNVDGTIANILSSFIATKGDGYFKDIFESLTSKKAIPLNKTSQVNVDSNHRRNNSAGSSDFVDDEYDMDEEDEEMDNTSDRNPSVTITNPDHHASYALMQSRNYTRKISSFQTNKIKRKETRQDLQTILKLDQSYQTDISQVYKDLLYILQDEGNTSNQDLSHLNHLAVLGREIGGGELLSKIGNIIFKEWGDSTQETQDEIIIARDSYIAILSNVLQFCNGSQSKISATSPLLSKLAFQPGLLDGMWCHIKTLLPSGDNKIPSKKSALDIHLVTSLIPFCDLFVQNSLALNDEEFLLRYTNQNIFKAPQTRINSEDLIVTMRQILYDLYWSKPVHANDIISPSRILLLRKNNFIDSSSFLNDVIECGAKARLLLSGTKLWNSLYERWCRLFRSNKFCDEECWWFDHLTSQNRDDNAAVISNNFNQSNRNLFDEENSEGSPMDIDVSDDEMNTSESVETKTDTNDALASSFKDPKMARVLTSIPQSIPFNRRVKLFNSLLKADRIRAQDETEAIESMLMSLQRGEDPMSSTRELVKVRRQHIYKDSMDQLNKLGKNLKKKIQVSLVNNHGVNEAGIDGGGVFKEYMDDLIKDAFSPSPHDEINLPPLFTATALQTLNVNVGIEINDEVLNHYEFLGRVLGKSVYESILVEPQFCLPFFNQLLGKQNTLDDLKNIDPEYYRHLNHMRVMNADEIESLGLTFEVTTIGSNGLTSKTYELIPGGSSIQVTKENCIRYIHLIAHRRLNLDSAAQTHAFLKGFRDIIPAAWVKLFSSYELQRLIGGDDNVKGFDVGGLKGIIQYSGGYHPSQPIIQWFWEVIEEMSPEEQRMFLKFMTSCSRQPLLGFNALTPIPCIQQVRLSEVEFLSDGNSSRLPTSSTCMNLLKLPNYRTKSMLKEKLLYAIKCGAGFELT